MSLLGGLLGGVLGIGANLLGASSSNKAIGKAADAQLQATKLGIDEQRRQFDLTRSDFAPYLQEGTAGLGQLGDLLGVNGPDKQAAALGIIQNSPVLARLIDQGTEGVLQNASATGGVRGGNTIDALANFRADAFNQVLNDQMARLGGLAGLGSGATGAVANFGAGTANAITQLLGQQGQSQAGSFLARAGVNNNMLNNISGIIGSLINPPKAPVFSFGGG